MIKQQNIFFHIIDLFKAGIVLSIRHNLMGIILEKKKHFIRVTKHEFR
jgi:hypothetical protein